MGTQPHAKRRLTRLASRAVTARVLNRVPTNKTNPEEAGAGEHQNGYRSGGYRSPCIRARRQAASVKIKESFGAGSGRSAGFYRQYAKVADPATASEEAAAAQKAHRYAGNEVAQASARWLPGSFQLMAQAAPSFGQPTPIDWASLASHIGLVFDIGAPAGRARARRAHRARECGQHGGTRRAGGAGA